MDIKIDKIPKGISIENMVVKPVRGVTSEGTTIYEDELQLKIQNNGTKTYSMLDCHVEYGDANGEFVGFDSDGIFDDLKPNGICLLSIPLQVPEDTESKVLAIKASEAESNFFNYGKYGILVCVIVIILIDWFRT